MNITAAALSETVIEAALGYLECQISVIPCMGKRASDSWSRWQVVRPPSGMVHWWYNKGWLQNVAVVCGRVSKGLVIIDLDGKEAVREYEKKFHHLITTFNVISGSGQGKHYYYRVEEITPTTRTKGFELRSDGCYVVAPPSKHPDTGQRYRVERYRDMMTLPDMREVQAWIRGKMEAKQAETKKSSIGEVRQATPYAAKALAVHCDRIASATQGERNDTLYMAALNMGNYVDNGWISRYEVENALMAAASHLSAEDGEGRSWRTVQSGINTGIARNKRRA